MTCCTSVLFKGNKMLRLIICDVIMFVTLLWDETSYICINSNFIPNPIKYLKNHQIALNLNVNLMHNVCMH